MGKASWQSAMHPALAKVSEDSEQALLKDGEWPGTGLLPLLPFFQSPSIEAQSPPG